jgi:hypothetical protein
MSVTAWLRRAGITVAVTAIAGMLAGCISDGMNPAATSQTTGDGSQMRYYGGPKSPMWPAQ